jgi:hypothetical protein
MIVESIMKHLLSKEVLYQPMKVGGEAGAAREGAAWAAAPRPQCQEGRGARAAAPGEKIAPGSAPARPPAASGVVRDGCGAAARVLSTSPAPPARRTSATSTRPGWRPTAARWRPRSLPGEGEGEGGAQRSAGGWRPGPPPTSRAGRARGPARGRRARCSASRAARRLTRAHARPPGLPLTHPPSPTPSPSPRYEAQHEVVARLVGQYEADPDDFRALMELLQQVRCPPGCLARAAWRAAGRAGSCRWQLRGCGGGACARPAQRGGARGRADAGLPPPTPPAQMQSYGQPPDDIVSEMHRQIGQDLPGGLQGLEEGAAGGGLPPGLEELLGGGGPGGAGAMDPGKCCIQ